MFFSLLPDIEYDIKPSNYPYSEAQFRTAKNFFRRFKINEDVFGYTVAMNKYAILDGEKPNQVAELYYENPFLDWVVLLTNNVINPLFDWPKTDNAIRRYSESKYGDPYAEILYYETFKVESGITIKGDSTGRNLKATALDAGRKVDEEFYNNPFTYFDGTNNISVPGSSVCQPVSAYDHEIKENEKKREIWILKPRYLDVFITEFKIKNNYVESSDYISLRSKKTGV